VAGIRPERGFDASQIATSGPPHPLFRRCNYDL